MSPVAILPLLTLEVDARLDDVNFLKQLLLLRALLLKPVTHDKRIITALNLIVCLPLAG